MDIKIVYSLFKTEINTRKQFDYYAKSIKRNSDIYRNFIKGSEMIVYHDDSVPKSVISYLLNNNITLKSQARSNRWEGTLWRFKELLNCNKNTIVILQDADSALDIENGLIKKLILRLCDNVYGGVIHHGLVSTNKLVKNDKWIMAGQSIFNMEINININDLIPSFLAKNREYDADELFLKEHIWPIIKDDIMINIERRALPLFLRTVKTKSSTPNWLLDSNHMDRIITNLTQM